MTLKDDLDTLFVAIDRLRVLSQPPVGGWMVRDKALADRGLQALARIRKRLANSVPIEQGEMEMGE